MNSREEQNVMEQDVIQQNQFGMYTIKVQIIFLLFILLLLLMHKY